MMKYCLLFFLLGSFYCNISGQEFALGYGMGYGSFRMMDLKTYNRMVASDLPFESRLVDDFPSYVFQSPELSVYWEQSVFGIGWVFHSTGSRISSSDYSGEYLLDLRVKGNGPYVMADRFLNPDGRFKVSLGIKLGMLISALTMEESLVTWEDLKYEEDAFFRSTDYFLEPGISMRYPFSVWILEVNAGYVLQGRGNGFSMLFNADRIPLMAYGDIVHPGWSGYRLGVGLSVNFSKLNEL